MGEAEFSYRAWTNLESPFTMANNRAMATVWKQESSSSSLSETRISSYRPSDCLQERKSWVRRKGSCARLQLASRCLPSTSSFTLQLLSSPPNGVSPPPSRCISSRAIWSASLESLLRTKCYGSTRRARTTRTQELLLSPSWMMSTNHWTSTVCRPGWRSRCAYTLISQAHSFPSHGHPFFADRRHPSGGTGESIRR